MAVMVISPALGSFNQSTSGNDAKISLNKDVLKVNAASSIKVKSWYKHWYKSHGKWKYVWKYYWKYKSTSTVKAASSYSSSCYKTTGKADTFSDPVLNSIMKSGAKYKYSHCSSNTAGLQRMGSGDCWAFSDYLNSKFRSAGYQSRIIQYSTAYSGRHRSVQLYQNGKWLIVPYRAYGYPYLIV